MIVAAEAPPEGTFEHGLVMAGVMLQEVLPHSQTGQQEWFCYASAKIAIAVNLVEGVDAGPYPLETALMPDQLADFALSQGLKAYYVESAKCFEGVVGVGVSNG